MLRTIDDYKQAGAEMRLMKTLGGKLVMDISKVLSVKDQDILLRALSRIDKVCSRAEDNMFRDYPRLGSDYIEVFYGDFGDEPINAIDEEITERAKQIAGGLFARTDH